MATVGHALAGLSIAQLADAKSRGGAMRNTWTGFMVLMGHLLDIVEWGIILIAPERFDQQWMKNSPILTAGISVVVCLGLAIFAKLRKPWAYLLVVLAIFSHLLLDNQLLRISLADAYGVPSGLKVPVYSVSAMIEVWLYGLIFICVWLFQISRRSTYPRRGRAAARVLIALAILAAITRYPAVWMPVYVLAGLHGLLMIRRELSVRSCWNLVPPLPVFALLAVELWAMFLYRHAVRLDIMHAGKEAEAAYRLVIAMPTRTVNTVAYSLLAERLRSDGDYASAEALLQRAMRIDDQPCWIAMDLAKFYTHSSLRGTKFYQPEKARELLEGVVRGGATAEAKRYALALLEVIRARGTSDVGG